MKRLAPAITLLALLGLAGICLAAPPGYRLLEATVASVNGEVIFLSDVKREACFYRCGVVSGLPSTELPLAQARQKLIADVLVLQERKKLGMGTVDNAAIDAMASDIGSGMKKCSSPCATAISGEEVRDLAARRLMLREFLEKSVAVFIVINEEEVRREMALRSRAGHPDVELSEEKVRRELFADEAANEIRNWFSRVTSKSRIVLSPMEEQ